MDSRENQIRNLIYQKKQIMRIQKKPDIPSQRHLALNKKFLLSPPTNKAYCHSTVIALSLLEEARKLIESVGYCPKASLSRFIELSNPN